MDTKVCTKCNEEKPVSAYYPRYGSTGIQSWCKPCTAIANKLWDKNNRERARATQRTYYWKDPEKARKRQNEWIKKNRDKRRRYEKTYALKYPEKHKDERKRSYERHKGKYRLRYKARIRRYTLKTQYGITEEQYNAMLAEQGGVCAICNRPERKKNNQGAVARLSVDHDHKTDEVRRLLCHGCNHGIGAFEENPNAMRRAAAYIEEHTRRIRLVS